jgi:hypothetical protein
MAAASTCGKSMPQHCMRRSDWEEQGLSLFSICLKVGLCCKLSSSHAVGGKNGEFLHQLEDYFYFAQIRAQGEDSMEKRQV